MLVSVFPQDAYGDTPLHDAMGKESSTIIDLLLSQPGINFSLKNRRGFNVLQHAALKGNPLLVFQRDKGRFIICQDLILYVQF